MRLSNGIKGQLSELTAAHDGQLETLRIQLTSALTEVNVLDARLIRSDRPVQPGLPQVRRVSFLDSRRRQEKISSTSA